MPQVPLDVSAQTDADEGDNASTIRLHNPTPAGRVLRAGRMTSTPDGDEILPIEYSDNYVTVFPGETVERSGRQP